MKHANELRAGNVFKVDNNLFLILKATFHKSSSGRRASTSEMKFKVKNLMTKSTTEFTYESHDKIEDIVLERRQCQFLYGSDDIYYFMDQTSFEQFEISGDNLGDNKNYIKADMMLDVLFYKEKPISVDLPMTIEMQITYTEPGLRGDTSGRVMKPATLENGYEIQVPIFCNIGDTIKLDTRSGEYMERIQNR